MELTFMLHLIWQGKIAWVFGDAEKASEFLLNKKKEVLLGQTGASTSISLADLIKKDGMAGAWRAIRGIFLYHQINNYINLVIDFHGHQIFRDGVFSGDPHCGNILELDGGRLGLLDYGQTTRLTDDERIKYSRVVSAIGSQASASQIAEAMRQAGFRTRTNGDTVLAEYAGNRCFQSHSNMLLMSRMPSLLFQSFLSLYVEGLFFDSDHKCRALGHATPQVGWIPFRWAPSAQL